MSDWKPDYSGPEWADIKRQLRQSMMRRQRLSDRSAEEDAGGCGCEELRAEVERLRAELERLYADSDRRDAGGEVWHSDTGPGE